MRKYFKKFEPIQQIIPLYVFFRRIPDLKYKREGEFRKNVNLKIIEPNKTTDINMEKLGEYSTKMEEFSKETRNILGF